MFLLHAVRYPVRSWPLAEVLEAWDEAHLEVTPHFPDDPVSSRAVADWIREVLVTQAKATVQANGDIEVPRSGRAILEGLERFYDELYPEASTSRGPDRFLYEEVEWLGEF
jgi:hypothetical protein